MKVASDRSIGCPYCGASITHGLYELGKSQPFKLVRCPRCPKTFRLRIVEHGDFRAERV
jgi:uncharacterized Zn-finger protein